MVLLMILNIASKIRSSSKAKLQRKVSITELHHLLIGMFVDRYELQDKLLKESKQDYLDRCLDFGGDFQDQQNCWLMHKDWNEFERMAIANNWQDLFIEDEKGGNNAW